VAEAFGMQADLEPVPSAMAPAAEIAIIDPSTTLRHWAPEMRRQAESDDLGFYQALVEAKLPFEFLSDQMMTPERLDAFKVVILANARCLSDEQCRMLDDYVAGGGKVVAAFETSTRDENGKRDVLKKMQFSEFVDTVQRIAAMAGVFIPDAVAA
jgi:hypothetical protein